MPVNYKKTSPEIVASVLTYGGKMALFKRSQHVSGSRGQWHCITGFLDARSTPQDQAIREVTEEAGITAGNLECRGSAFLTEQDDAGTTWKIHVFHFESKTESLTLNWENDDAEWIFLGHIHQYQTVNWLDRVYSALGTMVVSLKCPESDTLVGWA